MKVAIYARTDTPSSINSLVDQTEAASSWASAHGHQVVATFQEVGSGATDRGRPASMQLIAQALSDEHPFDAVLVSGYSRFLRDSFADYQDQLQLAKVELISITEPTFPDTESDEMVRRILQSFDGYSSRKGSKNARR